MDDNKKSMANEIMLSIAIIIVAVGLMLLSGRVDDTETRIEALQNEIHNINSILGE